jgi:hypothetical protein
MLRVDIVTIFPEYFAKRLTTELFGARGQRN